MDDENVEPVILVSRHEHSDPITPQLKVHSLVFDITHAVHTQLGGALSQKDWFYCDTSILGFLVIEGQIELAHVINQARG